MKSILIRTAYKILNHYLYKLHKRLTDRHIRNLQDIIVHLGEIR